MPIAASHPCSFGSCSQRPVSLPALGSRPLAAVSSEHIASPTKTAIPQDSPPGRDEPDQSEDPEGPRIRRCGGNPPAARLRSGRDKPDRTRSQGVRRGTSSPWESVPFGRGRPPDHTLPGLRGTPRSPMPSARTGQARPVRGPGGTADYTLRREAAVCLSRCTDGTGPPVHRDRTAVGSANRCRVCLFSVRPRRSGPLDGG